MQKRKIDELISHFNRKVADMDIDREYKMELLGMITAMGIACEKELSVEPERRTETPCDLCRHNPPSSGDGKPCSYCPAEGGIGMSEINCTNCAISDFKESLCERCDKMKRIGSADDIEKLIIRCLPSAQPEPSQVARDIATIIENEQDMRVIERNAQQWIPCSERLPDMHDEVLVTARGEVSIAWRGNDMPQPMFGDVIAWMPLPEPYKEEQE